MTKNDALVLMRMVRHVNSVYGKSGLNRPIGTHGTPVFNAEVIDHLAGFLCGLLPTLNRQKLTDFMEGKAVYGQVLADR